MKHIEALAACNQQKAWEIIEETHLVDCWKEIGAEVHLVGSLRMGLLMLHRDIDFHIYSEPLRVEDSFRAMAGLAAHSRIRRVEYTNLLHTEEACIEWHAWYEDTSGESWQLDMIHLVKGSRYDGYFEQMAERIKAALTEETKRAILRLKYETPESEKIMGVEYYQAVLRDGVRTYEDFQAWRRLHPVTGIMEWMPVL